LEEIRRRDALERFLSLSGEMKRLECMTIGPKVFREWAKPQHPDEPDEEYEQRKSILTIEGGADGPQTGMQD